MHVMAAAAPTTDRGRARVGITAHAVSLSLCLGGRERGAQCALSRTLRLNHPVDIKSAAWEAALSRTLTADVALTSPVATMTSSWVSDSFPHYHLNETIVLAFLKRQFTPFNDSDFNVHVVALAWCLYVGLC
jgi:hypothetical protein